MSSLKSYIVRIWLRGDPDDSGVLGIVEELEDPGQERCETIEEFLEALRPRRAPRPQPKRTFSSFEQLRRILRAP